MKIPLLLLIFAVLINLLSCNTQQGEVFFVPTLHGYHSVNQNYNYDSLKAIIKKLNPDIIAVEIRAEDIEQDSMYIAYNYPYEMYAVKTWFPKAKVVGIDWLGKDIEGKLMSFDYWQTQSELKKVEQKLSTDSMYLKRLQTCNSRYAERDSLLRSLSLQQLLNSTDAEITTQYYSCLKNELQGSPYEALITFSNERNNEVLKNISAVIKHNKGKRIVILTSDDMYVAIKDSFEHQPVYSNL